MNQQPTGLTILLREHREVEEHLEKAKGWIPTLQAEGAPAVDRLADELQTFAGAIKDDLALHIAHEDKALFPVLARHIGDKSGPIFVMLLEHRHMEGDQARFEAALATKDAAVLADSANKIVSVLSGHMWKEEQILFPMAQRTLSPEEWAEVEQLMGA
ncbi:MAG TPA: hemerythrin domain-containing protein [Symbiobacteriaceae bacterium]|nr:hemerythrin domain-containing protein [Symbiobacteriaceae bacterium]